jgi:cytidylate kinase
MKKLIIINGPMGVGKTTVCRELLTRLDGSVWLDGDWCWQMHPWVFSEENKRMVLDNITHLLHNYLANSAFNHIIFSWVLHQEPIFAQVLSPLANQKFELHQITLLCSSTDLRQRLIADHRDAECILRSMERLLACQTLNTTKIDTTHLTVADTVERIITLIK